MRARTCLRARTGGSPPGFRIRRPEGRRTWRVRRPVPSGFRIGSGGASPSAWRFQGSGSGSDPRTRGFPCLSQGSSCPLGPAGSGSDGCAPLAASAVRLVFRGIPAVFSDAARGHRFRHRSGQTFSTLFKGFPLRRARRSRRLDTWKLRPLPESRKQNAVYLSTAHRKYGGQVGGMPSEVPIPRCGIAGAARFRTFGQAFSGLSAPAGATGAR
jgi:hypothetical protein